MWEDRDFGYDDSDDDRLPFGLGQLKQEGDSVTLTFEDDGTERSTTLDDGSESVYYSFEASLDDYTLANDKPLETSSGEVIEPGDEVVLNTGGKILLSQLQAHAFEVDSDEPSIVGETVTLTSNGEAGGNRRYAVEWGDA